MNLDAGNRAQDDVNPRLRELLRALKKDPRNQAAFNELYSLASPILAKFIWNKFSARFGRSRDIEKFTEDAVQEVFLRLFRKVNEYRDAGKPTSWLCGIAKYVVSEHTRGLPAELSPDYDAPADPDKDTKEVILRRIEQTETVALISESTSEIDRVIVMANVEKPTGDAEVDERLRGVKKVNQTVIAEVLNEVFGPRFENWKPLSTNAVQNAVRGQIKS